MASTVKIKRSSVAGKVPTTSNIEAGELALNTADKVLYSTDGSTVFEIGSNLDTLSVNNHIEFTPRDADAPSHAEGRVFYHDEYKALTVYNDISDVSLQVGHEEWVRVYNNTGSQIDNGTPLYVTGASGEMPTVAPADATTEAKARVIGVATHDIADSSSGVATTRGLVSGINTSSLTAGQSIHVGSSGALQTAAPTYPYWPVDIGECIVSDATNGYIYVQIREHHFESFRVSGNQHNDGNLTIDGNLTVNGTQTITSQNNLSINDSFIYLNSGDNIGESGTTFTGTGLDDAYFRGYFEGTTSTTYYVRIDGVGTGTGGVDTFEWSKDNFSTTEATGVDITGADQELSDNIKIFFNATTGHTSGDTWSGTASPINVDTGWMTNRNTGTTGVGHTHMGVFFDVTDEKFKFFEEYDPEPNGGIDINHATFNLGTVVASAFEGDLTGDVTGSADSLTNGRTISITGDVSYTSGSFNGSSNVTGTGTIQTGSGTTIANYMQVANTIALIEASSDDASGILMGTDENIDLTDGAATSIGSSDTVYNVIDKLNEAMFNIQKGTYVRSVSFSADNTEGGEGTTVTLTLNVVGNANRYDIDWGDGNETNGTSDSTPSHTYTDNTNSPFTVVVRAYNNGAISDTEGSEATSTQADYITIYTADPVPNFAFYTELSGGTALTTFEANTGEVFYVQNNTTNINELDASTGTWTLDWGDGTTADSISAKDAEGGPYGARIDHTFSADSGSGTFDVDLTITDYSTATPAIFPITQTKQLKVFDVNIAAPDNITSKTISWGTSSSGTSPALAQGFTDSATSGKSAGDTISSTFPRFTTGTAYSSTMGTFFHTTGSVTQQINDSVSGSPTVDSSSVDYWNYNASGSAVSAAQRIYAKGLYETGTKARTTVAVTSQTAGVNKVELVTTEGNSNELLFVYDDVTSAPTVDVSSATVTHAAGSYNYISGVPYYNSGDTITLGGVTVTNLTGQTYYNGNAITVGDTNVESLSGTSISDQTYSYSTALAVADRNGSIPNADLSPSLEDLTVTIGSGDNAVKLTANARNVNGLSSTQTINSPIINVFNGTDVINESAIAVSDSLGSGFTTDGVRITGFSGANYTFGSTTDYYASNAWSGAETVAGTDEAIIRYGQLEHNAVDYSSGYLPVGPDLATNRSGTQYFRFAFKRNGVSTFRVRMTGKVSGFYIAAPGTTIDDTSTLNGWLDASIQYAGSGVPGADTGNGGNGSNGCAFTGGDIIADGTTYSNDTFDLTFGTESSTNAYNSQILVTIALNNDDSLTALSIEAAS